MNKNLVIYYCKWTATIGAAFLVIGLYALFIAVMLGVKGHEPAPIYVSVPLVISLCCLMLSGIVATAANFKNILTKLRAEIGEKPHG